MSSAGALEVSLLDRDLCSLLLDIQAEKATVRQKAVSKLITILRNRMVDFMSYMDSDNFETRWCEIFDAAYQSILKHSRSNAASVQGKNYDYIVMIETLAEAAMDGDARRLQYKQLIDCSVQVLRDEALRSNFGNCFVKLLQKHVLSVKWDLTVVTAEEWRSIIECCFANLNENKIAKQSVISCLSIAVQKFLDNCPMSTLLVAYLPRLLDHIRHTEKDKTQYDLMVIAYHAVQALAVDSRTEARVFLESLTPYVQKAYAPQMKDENMKSTLLRLMHLQLMLNSPGGKQHSPDDRLTHDVPLTVVDDQARDKMFRQFFHVVTTEMKHQAGKGEEKFATGFLDFAARICYTVYWNESGPLENESEGSAPKKVKKSHKLQSLMDLVGTGSNLYNLQWLIVLSLVLERYCGALLLEDYQPLLQLLSEIQPVLQTALQQQAFYRCCKALVSFEETRAFRSSQGALIDAQFCNDLWYKIIATAFRGCSSTASKTADDSSLLVQLLVRHRKYPNVSFLNDTILEALYSYSIKKTNATVGCIVAILETEPNVDCLGDTDTVLAKLLEYLYPTARQTVGKIILHGRGQLDAKLLAKVSVLATVSKHDCGTNDAPIREQAARHLAEVYVEEDDTLRQLERRLLLQNVDELIVSEGGMSSVRCEDVADSCHRITYNVNEVLFERLCKSLNFEKQALPEQDTALGSALGFICYDLELYLEIINIMVHHQAYNEEQCFKCLLTKKVQLKFQELNLGFERLLRNSDPLSGNDVFNIGERLLTIFGGPYHGTIKKVLQKIDVNMILKWCMKQIVVKANDDSQHMVRIVPQQLSRDQQIQRCFLLTVAQYLQYEGMCTAEVHDFLDHLELNVHSSLDVFYIHEVSRVLLRQPPHEFVAEWVLNHLQGLCKYHHTSPGITELIIDIYADLVQFVRPFESLVRNVTVILHSFMKKCTRLTYSTELQVKIIGQVKFLLQAFPQHCQSPQHEQIYLELGPLMASSGYRVKIEVIRNMLRLFQSEWVYGKETPVPAIYYEFQSKLYGTINIDDIDDGNGVDVRTNAVSGYLQLLLGTFGVSFECRRRSLHDLLLLLSVGKVTDAKVTTLVRLVSLVAGIEFIKVVQMNIDMLLELWLTRGQRLKDFPRRLTGESGSIEDFMQKHRKSLAFVMLCTQPEHFEKFCTSVRMEPEPMVKLILPRFVAFLLPQFSKCEALSAKYTAMACRAHKALKPSLRQMDLKSYVFDIVKHLTYRLSDAAELEKLLEHNVPRCNDDYLSVSVVHYTKATDHLKQSICEQGSPEVPLLSYLCVEKKYSLIEKLLTEVKRWLWASEEQQQKLIHLHQYVVLVEQLREYLDWKENNAPFKKYLVREVVYFLCNLLSTIPVLRLPTLNGLDRIFKLLVSSSASDMLSQHLHFIVSSLLEVETVEPLSAVSRKCLSLLNFLIIDQCSVYAEAIGKLNYLPADERFADLRVKIAQQKAKYCQAPCLRDEIVGLMNLPNLRYEDIAALKILVIERKTELRTICRELLDQSGSNADESILHRLIYMLLVVVRTSPFDKRTIEALKCLGELGPIDLGTMLLKSDIETVAYDPIDNFESCVKKAAETILAELDALLISKNVTVARTASLACYQMLHGNTFQSAVAHLPALHPFLGRSSADVVLFSHADGNIPRLSEIFDENEHIDYRSFVQRVAIIFLAFLRNTMLNELAHQELSFAEKLLPLTLQLSLKLRKDAINSEIGTFINYFFTKFAVAGRNGDSLFSDPKAIQLMLTFVECVRINNQMFPEFRIVLKYLPIAKAARYCQAHFKAILYCELWHECEMEQSNKGAKTDRSMLEIMKASHAAIGVSDAVKTFLNPIYERAEFYRLEQKHARSLVFQDACTSHRHNAGADTPRTYETLQSLKDCNLYGIGRILPEAEAVDYECAWRLCDWSVVVESDSSRNGAADVSVKQDGLSIRSELFERFHYKALKSLAQKDALAVDSAVLEARRAIAAMLQQTSTESTKHIYLHLCRLRQLQQIEDFGEIQFFRQLDCEHELLAKWNQQDTLPYSEFGLKEKVLSQRLSILDTARLRAKRKWTPQAVYSTLLLIIHESRLRGYNDCALRNIANIGRSDLPANIKAVVLLEDAQLNWSLGHRKLACDLTMEVLDNKRYDDRMVNAVALRLYGQFQAESDTKELKMLHTDYFQKSHEFVERVDQIANTEEARASQAMGNSIGQEHCCFDSDRNHIVLHTVAKYADREFVRLNKVLQSQEWRTRQANMNRMKQEVQRLTSESGQGSDQKRREIRRLVMMSEKNLQRDQKAIQAVEDDRRSYLEMALLYYIEYTKQDTIESDMVVFRIIALWLQNEKEEKAQQLIDDRLVRVPAYKLLPVLPQLAPRLSVRNRIGKVVHRTLLQCAKTHPHHTLPYVFAQLNAFKDQDDKDIPHDDERLLGAKALYKELCLSKSGVSSIVEQMNRMNLALIQLANKSVSSTASFQEYVLTSKDPLRLLKDLNLIHCPTMALPVVASGDYQHRLIGVSKWESKVVGVGGINAPKKLKCLCTDGTVRIQLVKGKDDMRQDAVMQQVFGIMNILLRHDKETAVRKLRILTYKVVPLSRQSGILEWCENTVPIGVWLAAGHKKYRPDDYDPAVARKKFQNNAQPGMTVDQKLQNYLNVCQKIQPVFRYYFLEHYHKPGVWFERRQSYVNSVATSSMIGHILGIGDRHVQNILVDKGTAEVIHIDFGIAFELGKNLPTPETIPFRLTRDLVDGMGISGVEGVFKKACEKTMEVLRNNQAPILTILEVLLYDPLYTWNVLSNKKANRQQLLDSQEKEIGGDGIGFARQEVNVTAERALIEVSKKLEGMADDKYFSVEGQVQRLIFNATSERNLCQLFQGWQPYL
ncbi:serine/threonine-protein kinase ATM [Anopheles cruzii]|uniref:serine/threonine-protein kinase ATM n=1 Tax=Anopheles cruzii TaxID=68878 RepID=UPI0022EC9296|nr:serine/threonine-protein kinase ATM [Anopheles cruzii]